jgi:hypothetical protein
MSGRDDPRGPDTYPIVLREGLAGQVLAGFLLIVAAFGLLVGVGLVWIALRDKNPIPLLGLPVVGGLVWLMAWVFCERVLSSTVLTADSLEARGPFGSRRIARSQIAGYRIRRNSSGYGRIKVVPRDGGAKTLTMGLFKERPLVAWMGAIPDLNAKDREASYLSLLEDSSFGASPGRRDARVVLYSHLGNGLLAMGMAGAAWVVLWPQPRVLAFEIAALAPLASFALALAGRGAFRIFNAANDAHPKVVGPVFIGAALGGRLLYERPLVDWTGPVLPAVALTTLGLGLAWVLDRRTLAEWKSQPLAVLFLALWSWGAIVAADMVLDRTAPSTFPVTVLNKRIIGRYRNREVRIGPWGPMTRGQILRDRALFDQVEVGGQACMLLRPGALGMAWFEAKARPCGTPPPPPSPPAAPTTLTPLPVLTPPSG